MFVVAKAHCLLSQGSLRGHQGITLKASILGYEYYRWPRQPKLNWVKTNITLLKIHFKSFWFQTCLSLVKTMEGPWGGVEQKRKHGLWWWGSGNHTWNRLSVFATQQIAICFYDFRCESGKILIIDYYLDICKWHTTPIWSESEMQGEANFCHINRAWWHLDPDGAKRQQKFCTMTPLCLIAGRMHLQGERNVPEFLGIFCRQNLI